jgi:hypothetical protein
MHVSSHKYKQQEGSCATSLAAPALGVELIFGGGAPPGAQGGLWGPPGAPPPPAATQQQPPGQYGGPYGGEHTQQ